MLDNVSSDSNYIIMVRRFYLLGVIIALYLVLALGLHLIYGPSYPFLAGEDCWQPDGQGGWRAHGSPLDSAPTETSVEVPLLLNYLPIFVPALVLILFLFTPLRRHLDPPPSKTTSDTDTPPASDN